MMPRLLFPTLVLAAALSGSALAQAPAPQDDLAQAKAAYRAALKSHDQAAITRTHEALRAVYSEHASDTQEGQWLAAAPPACESKEDYLALVHAKIDYRDAVASRDRAAIVKAKAALRDASHHDWVVRHAKHC